MSTVQVGSDRYYALPAKERFVVASDTLANYEARPGAKWDATETLQQEVYSLRVAISCGDDEMGIEADPLWDITHNTLIRETGGKKVIFQPSAAQYDDLLTLFNEDLQAGVPGRYWMTKTRRVGGSMGIGQWIRVRVCRQEGKQALIAVHDKPTAQIMFRDIYKMPWSDDPLHPDATYANKGELFFEKQNGLIRVVTVKGGEGLAASTGIHYLHLSEFLRYEENGVDFEDLYNNLIMTIPQAPVETFVIGESSGRGDGGVAYGLVQEAYNNRDHWKPGDFRIIFLPSYKRWDAHQKITSVNERADLLASLEPDERHIVDNLKVPLEHIKWRRWFEATQIQARSPKARRAMMRQECPLTFMDCFQAKGATEYDPERIRELMIEMVGKPLSDIDPAAPDAEMGAPLWCGELRVDSLLYDPRHFKHVAKTPMPRFIERPDGEMFVWRKPVAASPLIVPHRYCMGIDISEGGEDGNYSIVAVHDRDTKALVAIYRGKAQHDELLRIVRLMAKWYNDAYIANEVNRFKKWTEDLASTDRIAQMYRRRAGRDTIDHDDQDALGWLTTPNSKDVLVDAGHNILTNVPQWIRWEQILSEFKTFKRESKLTRRGPRKGIYDDCVMAVTISWYCDRDMPKPGKDPLEPVVGPGLTPLQAQFKQWKEENKGGKQPRGGVSRQKVFEGQR